MPHIGFIHDKFAAFDSLAIQPLSPALSYLELSPDDMLKVVADFVQEESWRERSEILRLGLSEMMDERNDLRQIILSLEKWRRDGRISAAEYAELKAKYGKRLADADRLIEELKEITREAS